MRDLATVHELVSDVFHRPKTPDGWRQFQLSDEQTRFYEVNGYLAGVPVLDETQVDVLCEELKLLIDPSAPGHELFYEFHSNESTDPNTVLFHALGGWRITPAMHDSLWNPALLAPASQMLGGAVRFWHDQLFVKPPRHGGVVAWHQDYSYWTRTRPMAHLTCWIALDDATIDNGCIQYVPGSHRWELLPITGLAGDMDSIRQTLTPQQWEQFQNPTRLEIRRGHAAFHHPLMVHGSFANRTDGPRRALVINLVRDGVCSASNEPLLAGVPAVPAGQPLSGPFFPLLYDPAQASATIL